MGFQRLAANPVSIRGRGMTDIHCSKKANKKEPMCVSQVCYLQLIYTKIHKYTFDAISPVLCCYVVNSPK